MSDSVSGVPYSSIQLVSPWPTRLIVIQMRLLHTGTGQFVVLSNAHDIEYAILSHTWDQGGEQTYQEVERIQTSPIFVFETLLVWAFLEIWWRALWLVSSITPALRITSYVNLTVSHLSRTIWWFLCYIGYYTCSAARYAHRRFPFLPAPRIFRKPPFLQSSLLPLYSYAHVSSPWHKRAQLVGEYAQQIRLRNSRWLSPRLSNKIRGACQIARRYGHRLIWIDSCCIDKTSSTELSEAINSMYAWYRSATVCYVFLSDVDGIDPRGYAFSSSERLETMLRSRWFTRGWTLQELIAPTNVVFFSREWHFLGTKASLAGMIEEATGIARAVLMHQVELHQISVGTRMSWAARRQTTRVEDEAYSLFGIFGINMPTLYGEGRHAFIRLQEEILRRIPDQTLFTWGQCYPVSTSSSLSNASLDMTIKHRDDPSFFAVSPSSFSHSAGTRVLDHPTFARRLGLSHLDLPNYTSTPFGLQVRLPLVSASHYFPQRSPTTSKRPGLFDHPNVFLALFACESVGLEGSLLAVPCMVDDMETNLTRARRLALAFGTVREEGALHHDGTVALSPTQLASCPVTVKSFYIPTVAPQSLEPRSVLTQLSFDAPLAPWSASILRGLGYSIFHGRDDQCRQHLVLSKGRDRIHVRAGAGWAEARHHLPGRHWIKVPVWITYILAEDEGEDPFSGGLPAPHELPPNATLWAGDASRNHTSYVFHASDGLERVLRIRLSRRAIEGSTRCLDLDIIEVAQRGLEAKSR